MIPGALLDACELRTLPTSLWMIGACVSIASFSEMLGVGVSPTNFEIRLSLRFFVELGTFEKLGSHSGPYCLRKF